MKNRSFSALGLLIAGMVFFILGLLVLIHENTINVVLSQILPNAQAIEVFGIIMQVIGQVLMISGVVNSSSHKFTAKVQSERQMTTASFNQVVQQMQVKWQTDRQALVNGFNQTVAKLEGLIANQRAMAATFTGPSSCKFCGTKLDNGPFCSKCGKAN